MILTCPECGTQYVVKDGAIPPAGRQVRCASCKHSWHQDPITAEEPAQEVAPPAAVESGPAATGAPASEQQMRAAADEDVPPAVDQPAQEESPAPDEMAVEPAGYRSLTAGSEPPPGEDRSIENESAAAPAHTPETLPADDDFAPFGPRDYEEPPRKRRLLPILLIILIVALAASAFWFLAPPQWKARVGLSQSQDTPLQLMMTHRDRQKLKSGNELLVVTGRVINPTEESQPVPPIQAQLFSKTGKIVYSWTIPSPARTLPPGASAPFNSAEVNVPAGGDQLTITLVTPPKA